MKGMCAMAGIPGIFSNHSSKHNVCDDPCVRLVYRKTISWEELVTVLFISLDTGADPGFWLEGA